MAFCLDRGQQAMPWPAKHPVPGQGAKNGSKAQIDRIKTMDDLNQLKLQILSKTPLDQLVGEQVRLQNRGGKKTGCCPFHAEKTPSFYLYDDHYHCFGCGAHGDAISWVRHNQGLGFIESLRWLAEKYGLDISGLEKGKGNLLRWQQAAQKTKVLAEAQEFFQKNLQDEPGRAARDYLTSRGFPKDCWNINGFGYAPDTPDTLIKHLKKLGYPLSELEEASLANSFRGHSFDFFRHRIMIPIRDVQGRLLAFGGRALGGQQQKYKNSRYDKGLILFGLDQARKVSRSRGRIIVVEGYLDALKMRMAGFPETVACQGTALTREHLRSLHSAAPELILLFDGDPAGQKAPLKTLEYALEFPELKFRVAELSEGEDPDSFLEKSGAGAMESLLAKSGELLSWSILKQLGRAPAEAIPALINQDIIPWLAKVPDPINRSYLEDQVSRLSGVPVTVIRSALARQSQTRGAAGQASRPTCPDQPPTPPGDNRDQNDTPTPLSPLAFEFFGHVFYSEGLEPDIRQQIRQILSEEIEVDWLWAGFAQEMLRSLEEGKSPATQEDCFWTLSTSPFVAEFIAQMRSLKTAFQTKDRRKIFAHLRLLFNKNKIESAVVSTKLQISELTMAGVAGSAVGAVADGVQKGKSEAAGTFRQPWDQESLREHTSKLLQLQSRLREISEQLLSFSH